MLAALPALALPHAFLTQTKLLRSLTIGSVLLLGLVIRLGLAPAPGFEYDIGVNQGWGRSAVELGLARSYVEQVDGNMLPNYAPLPIMLFAGAAAIQQGFFGGFEGDPLSYRMLIKMPTILFDLFTVVLLFALLSRWKGFRAGAYG